MSDLSIVSLVLGALFIVAYGIALLRPEAFMMAVRAFPRHATLGKVLTAVALIWVAALVILTPLDRAEPFKPAVYVLAPVLYFLTIRYLDELLAPRALGGLMLLAGHPALSAARWEDTPWRLVVTVLAYIWIIKGMIFVLSPYRFRHFTEILFQSQGRLRSASFVGIAFGSALLILAFTVY